MNEDKRDLAALRPFREWLIEARGLRHNAASTYSSLVRRIFAEAGELDDAGERVVTAAGLARWAAAFEAPLGPYAAAWRHYGAWGAEQGWGALPALPSAAPAGQPPDLALVALAALGGRVPALVAARWPAPLSWGLGNGELAALDQLGAAWSAPHGWQAGQPVIPGAPGGLRPASVRAALSWARLGARSPLERGLARMGKGGA